MQFDAHADLREEFEGTPYSHASVMRRVLDDGIPTLPVGIRSLSKPGGGARPRGRGCRSSGATSSTRADGAASSPLLAALPEKVYLTFDIDYFDPALVPATGTPEPGGGAWYPTLRLLRQLFATQDGGGHGPGRAGADRRPAGERLPRREARSTSASATGAWEASAERWGRATLSTVRGS